MLYTILSLIYAVLLICSLVRLLILCLTGIFAACALHVTYCHIFALSFTALGLRLDRCDVCSSSCILSAYACACGYNDVGLISCSSYIVYSVYDMMYYEYV